MLNHKETRLLGLRGLHLDARRNGDAERARRYAEEASRLEPGAPWSARALLEDQTARQDWGGALETLDRIGHSPMAERAVTRRHRAVLLTAQAMESEPQDPDRAYKLAQEAHKLAPDLVPAAALAARRASATGDVRRAAKIVETTWAREPHPELAEVYAHARQGDSALDRLKRIRTLVRQRENHPEGMIALARAAIDAQEWREARGTLEPLARRRPSARICALMAEIEDGQHGDRGRVREWLARALTAPRDPAWTADGYVSERWLPMSPLTGEIDAFQWRVPVEPVGGTALEHDDAPGQGALLDAPRLEAAPEPAPRPASAEPGPAAAAAPAAPKAKEESSEPAPQPAPSTGGIMIVHEESRPEPDEARRAKGEPGAARANGTGESARSAKTGSAKTAASAETSNAGPANPADTERRPPDDPGVERDEDAPAARRAKA